MTNASAIGQSRDPIQSLRAKIGEVLVFAALPNRFNVQVGFMGAFFWPDDEVLYRIEVGEPVSSAKAWVLESCDSATLEQLAAWCEHPVILTNVQFAHRELDDWGHEYQSDMSFIHINPLCIGNLIAEFGGAMEPASVDEVTFNDMLQRHVRGTKEPSLLEDIPFG